MPFQQHLMLPYRSAMPGVKRSHPEAEGFAGTGDEEVHPSRRLKYTEADRELAEIFKGLGDEISSVRLDATRNLLKRLSAKSPDQSQRLGNAITRLIKGVCSGAKAARPGFSVALIEVLRLARKVDPSTTVVEIVDKAVALTNPEGRQSGEEKRNHLIGRRFAFQAVLQSDILADATEDNAKYVFGAIAELAAHKDWLRSECGALLLEFLKTSEGSRMKDASVRILIDSWAAKNLIKTPEGVALWLTIKTTFPAVKLPKGHWHHNNPLSAQDRPLLTKALLKTEVDADDQFNGPTKKKSGTRQTMPHLAWAVILSYLYERNREKELAQFWEECVAKQMFNASSSPETKSLGLQILTRALATAPVELLGKITHVNIIRCILDQRANSERLLFVAAKIPLDQMVSRAKKEPAAAAEIVLQVLKVAPHKVDKVTKSTIDALLASADSPGLLQIVEAVNAQCLRLEDPSDASNKRRMLSDILLVIVRSHRGDASQKWLKYLLRSLTDLGYKALDQESAPSITDSQVIFRERLTSALGVLVALPLEEAAKALRIVVDQMHSIRKSLVIKLDETTKKVIGDARKQLKDAEERTSADESNAKVNQGFQLLLALGMLNVYKQEPESLVVLEDIITCYQSPKESGDAASMLVELLLSFVSKQSMLFRRLAEQVFAAFAPEITAEALQSMIEILSQKESLAGQQELFKQGDEEEEEEEDSDEEAGSDVDMEDMEDASDVEIVNGVVSGAQDPEADTSETSSTTSSASGNESGDAADDEETVFDRKLAEALGTAAADDEDSDGSDMDDDQMMALEPHLTTIFAERKKGSNTKQDNVSAKANMINFKNRVLDLLAMFVKSQFANPLVLDLLHPLCTLTRTTSSQPTAQKALVVLEALFAACRKNQTLPEVPNSAESSEGGADGDDAEDDSEEQESKGPLLALLRAVHTEMTLGGSKVHAAACSKSSMFLAKMLISQAPENFELVGVMYVKLQTLWRSGEGKIHPSVFNDWHNFSMQK